MKSVIISPFPHNVEIINISNTHKNSQMTTCWKNMFGLYDGPLPICNTKNFDDANELSRGVSFRGAMKYSPTATRRQRSLVDEIDM